MSLRPGSWVLGNLRAHPSAVVRSWLLAAAHARAQVHCTNDDRFDAPRNTYASTCTPGKHQARHLSARSSLRSISRRIVQL